jgi:hypothetical protein
MLQYPKTTHVTLPSVDNYYLDTNILRDPPKAIFTRKIDKVFDNDYITKLVDDSPDRINEYIRVYARGKNPFVKVSYDNYGTNGGQVAGSSRTQASLPYKVNREGAFRPTGLASPRDQLPLSRMAYVLSEPILTTPSVINYANERACPEKFREVKQELLSTSCRPTATIRIDTPITEVYSTKYKINSSPLKTTVNSGVQKIQQQKVQNKVNMTEVRKNTIHAEGRTNIAGTTKNNLGSINTEKYIIEDMLNTPVQTNVTDNSKYRRMEYQNQVELERNFPVAEAYSNIGDNSKYKRMEYQNEIELGRNFPVAEAYSNRGGNFSTIDTISSREYKLTPTLDYGGFQPQSNIPSIQRPEISENMLSEKNSLAKRAYENYENRYQSIYPQPASFN